LGHGLLRSSDALSPPIVRARLRAFEPKPTGRASEFWQTLIAVDVMDAKPLLAASASVEQTTRVDDCRLAGHGLGAAHGDRQVGAVVLVGCLPQKRARGRALDLLGPQVR